MSTAATLEQIAKEVAVCTRCSLCKTRTNTVPGEGNPEARLLFIGEAPGYHEDRQGRPFVGESGQLLNRLLNYIRIPRQEVFIANVVKCRPPNNADPTPDQIAACKPYLDRQIAAINPGLIVTLGRFSMARYWPGQRISQIHGQPKKENGRLYLPMFHPAAALRDDRVKAMFKEDGVTIPELLIQAEEIARTELWGIANSQPEPEQPMLAEPSARSGYSPAPVAPAPAEPVDIEVKEVGAVQPEPVPVTVFQEVSEAGPTDQAALSASVFPPKTARPAATGTRPARPARKKTPPGAGEQLTMF